MNSDKGYNIDTGEKSWLTPPHIIMSLGEFDLDPCCPPNMPWKTAKWMVCQPENGLEVDWTGKRVWLNPPYGRESEPFLKKMTQQSKTFKPDGGGGIALLLCRTDTRMWHDFIFPYAHSLFFMRGRVKFYRKDGKIAGTAPAPSVLVSYSRRDTIAKANSGLKGHIIYNKQEG